MFSFRRNPVLTYSPGSLGPYSWTTRPWTRTATRSFIRHRQIWDRPVPLRVSRFLLSRLPAYLLVVLRDTPLPLHTVLDITNFHHIVFLEFNERKVMFDIQVNCSCLVVDLHRSKTLGVFIGNSFGKDTQNSHSK